MRRDRALMPTPPASCAMYRRIDVTRRIVATRCVMSRASQLPSWSVPLEVRLQRLDDTRNKLRELM